MLSTHSPIFIDRRGHGNVFLVRRDGGRTSVRQIREDYLSVIEELGARNSDILQSDFVLYTEGPTDAQIIEEIANRHISNWDERNISIQHLGGSNIQNCEPDELAEVNQNFGFILDSDRSSPDDNLKRGVQKFQEKCDESGVDVFIHILDKREIENYFTPEGINDSLGLNVGEDFVGDHKDIPKDLGREIISEYIEVEVDSEEQRTCSECGHTHAPRVGSQYEKKQGVKIVKSMYDNGQNITELEGVIGQIIEKLDA